MLDAFEGQDLEVVRDAGNIEGEVSLVGGGEHPMFLVLVGLRAKAAVLGARRLSQIEVWGYVSQSAKWVV